MFWTKKSMPLYYASREFYKKPDDILHLERLHPVQSTKFTIALLKFRFPDMDSESQTLAIKTLTALQTGAVFDSKKI